MKITRLFFSIFLAVILSSCGLREAVDATRKIPRKLDTTNEQMKKSNRGIKKTNDHVKKTNEALEKSNQILIDLINELKKTNAGPGNGSVAGNPQRSGEPLKNTDGTERTSASVHHQTLAVAISEMLKPENTRYLDPPTGMIPHGLIFAREANSDEIAHLIHTFLMEVESAQPDEVHRDSNGQWQDSVVRELDYQKRVKFTACLVISGLAPQSTIEKLVNEQILNGGRFQETAEAILAMRFAFIHDFLLGDSLFARKLVNPGHIFEATRLANYLTFIIDLRYLANLRVSTEGMLDPANNIIITVDIDQTIKIWKRIESAIENELLEKYKNPSHPDAIRISGTVQMVKKNIEKLTRESDRRENSLASD